VYVGSIPSTRSRQCSHSIQRTSAFSGKRFSASGHAARVLAKGLRQAPLFLGFPIPLTGRAKAQLRVQIRQFYR
jgi:hypothetical protein